VNIHTRPEIDLKMGTSEMDVCIRAILALSPEAHQVRTR
jgi:hypothetical protein